MPETITNPKIITLLNTNVAEMESINEAQEQINKRCDALAIKSNEFKDLMNEEYGWGNWQDVNAKEYTFIPREEFKKSFYIIQNPAVREQVHVDDVKLEESSPQVEEVSLEKFKELYPNHEAFKDDGAGA